MTARHYRLRLVFAGPLLSRAVGTLGFGVDAAMQRYRGRPVIAGSLVRGNLRHALEHFAEVLGGHEEGADLIERSDRWFGIKSREGFEPARGEVEFHLFWRLVDDACAPIWASHRHRITIDPQTGRTKSRHLQIIEDRFGAGASPTFEGDIQAQFQDALDAEAFERWLNKALDYIAGMGALKGGGFGRLDGAELIVQERVWSLSNRRRNDPGGDRLGIVLHLDRPFCIARPRTPDSNIIEGEDHIPGSVIKAVIARALGNDSPRLQELYDFDRLIVTHALPAASGRPERGVPLPLSLASFGGEIHDLASEGQPVLMKWEMPQEQARYVAPAFRPDWKGRDWDAAVARFGAAPTRPARWLHVRTAIDRSRDIAAQSQLFSQDCVDPCGTIWCADIELGLIEASQRDRVRENLIRLFQQALTGIGKTKARARVEVCFQPFDGGGRPEPRADGRFIVLLRSPARLLPSRLDFTGINTDEFLATLYRQYWSYASKGTLRLEHYFATERRVGGEFHWRHYRGGRHVPYEPEWLTEPGSVFVVSGTNDPEAAADVLGDWARFGLPPAPDRADDDWRTDPYRRENGFGEIMVNHPMQLKLIETWQEDRACSALRIAAATRSGMNGCVSPANS